MSSAQKELFDLVNLPSKFWLRFIDTLSEMLLIINDKGYIVACNKPFADVFNKHPKDFINLHYKDFIKIDFFLNLKIEDLLPFYEEKIWDRWYYITVKKEDFDELSYIIFFFKDITCYKKTKENIFQREIYTSIGTLASGIAHEINNPLTGIIGFVQMLKMLDESEERQVILGKILDCAGRCKKIVENLLIYARQKAHCKSLVTINDIIEKSLDLMSYNLKKSKIEVKVQYENVPLLMIDSQQILYTIISILLNAQDSIVASNRDKGYIFIKTHFDTNNKKVQITITDNGCGISEDITNRIFDPLFTTKQNNNSIGLGLSTAYVIIKEHNGNIFVTSEENVGTTFVIELPLSYNLSGEVGCYQY